MDSGISVDGVMSEDVLQQLRVWQQEQKNRLIEQQQQQRLLLIEKQKKLLSMINTCDGATIPENTSLGTLEPSNFIVEEGLENPKENRCNSPNISITSPNNVDDVPLKKPKSVRTFSQLLETSMSSKDQVLSSQNAGQAKKFPFLKRGQGISRFGVISKPRVEKRTQSKATAGKENRIPFSSTTSTGKEAPCFENKIPFSSTTNATTKEAPKTNKQPVSHMRNQVKLKSVPLEPLQDTKVSMEIVPFQAQVNVDESLQEVNSSKNEEDLAVFELLERFANINASFSSSSSLIGQLIDKGVTHLPSPSKVINFLSRKQTNFSVNNSEEAGIAPEKKAGKPTRHVRFAETVDADQPRSMSNEDCEKPWLADIPEENACESHASPYISNTIRPSHQSDRPASPIESCFDLDETPTSPIGFPDYQKLFGNPIRSLFTNEELPSPTQDDSFLKNNNPLGDLSDPVVNQMKGAALPLPIEDPRIVYQTSLLRSRLTSLEREIANYRRETEALRRARKEHEESKQKLEQEQEKFRRYTENEKRRLQLLYSEEQKRVRIEQLKDLPQLKENEEQLSRLREELKQTKEEHRQKENKWMANQTKVQEKIRTLEIRNRELAENLEKVRNEEQNLRRRLNASLRPGALAKNSKSDKPLPVVTEESGPEPQPQSPQVALVISNEAIPSPRNAQKEPNKVGETVNPKKMEEICATNSSPGSGTVSQTVLPDGTKLVLYPNGNRKEIWPDGRGTQVVYYNGDIKQKLADGSVVYTYADSGTKHTTKPDGTDILEFSSGQIETTYPDGRSHVLYPGGAQKTKYPDGREDSQLPDGTKLWTDGKGHGVMTFPSGIREIYTPICKRREYPDGTVKTVYEDGRSETRYANGRIRVKNKDGQVITDTGEAQTQE